MMEGRYEFAGAEVLALLDESRAASERVMTEAQRYLAAGVDLSAPPEEWSGDVDHPGTGAPPGLWLMNDRGVYLRSNARRRADDSVAFAHGHRAEIPAPGEPVCEFIDAAQLAPLQPGDTLVVNASEDKLRLSLVRPG
jgi:hypothetical protein